MPSIQYSEDPKLRTAQRIVFWAVIGLAGVTVFGLLFGLIIQLLWNATLASMFDVPISFWQAVGIFILAKILFGFGGGTSGRSKSGGSRKRSRRAKRATATSTNVGEEQLGDDAEVADLPADEQFRRFWAEQGREAYDAYQEQRQTEGDADTQER